VHTCEGAGCLAFCVPACFAGGFVAGIVVDFVGLRRTNELGFWVAASGIGLLTGAMGCVCAGTLGLAGLVAGFAISAAPGMMAAAARRRHSN
jgi:hypothetical protein